MLNRRSQAVSEMMLEYCAIQCYIHYRCRIAVPNYQVGILELALLINPRKYR